MMGGFDGVMGTFGGLWILLPLLFWGGLLVLIAWAVIRIFPEQWGGERPQIRRRSSEEILRERFARGEIDAEEYERSLSVLGERGPLKGGV